MLQEQIELLESFNAKNVEYVVVGGHAVNAHGVPRMTKDLDVFIRPTAENGERVYQALVEFGALLAGMSPAEFHDRKSIFQIGIEPNRVDVVQQIDGVSFEQVWGNRVEAKVNGYLAAPFIAREDLIANKLRSGRAQDIADVEQLKRLP